MARLKITGVDYFVDGKQIVIQEEKILVDGKEIDMRHVKTKKINIIINGNVESLTTPYARAIYVKGDAGSIQIKTGNINFEGDINGDVKIENGKINCGRINGNVSAGGDIHCYGVYGNVHSNGNVDVDGSIGGRVKILNGNLRCRDIGGNVHLNAGSIESGHITGNVFIGDGDLQCWGIIKPNQE